MSAKTNKNGRKNKFTKKVNDLLQTNINKVDTAHKESLKYNDDTIN